MVTIVAIIKIDDVELIKKSSSFVFFYCSEIHSFSNIDSNFSIDLAIVVVTKKKTCSYTIIIRSCFRIMIKNQSLSPGVSVNSGKCVFLVKRGLNRQITKIYSFL